ncbi:hypothetical protein TW95_gp1501 [Pandoravirus inopinatum]|uniref:Uncharacterized protein n=1 Tax=Pandoravirus inopinatum TaxID=1605721 RepID=A0A0B5J8J4_9VIRU|nr:hypothetical protein TW95_gp1501 [Pandoravirus inopinatum]AJF98235.1 hypothetical protein [Pandoravirus inopinatum]
MSVDFFVCLVDGGGQLSWRGCCVCLLQDCLLFILDARQRPYCASPFVARRPLPPPPSPTAVFFFLCAAIRPHAFFVLYFFSCPFVAWLEKAPGGPFGFFGCGHQNLFSATVSFFFASTFCGRGLARRMEGYASTKIKKKREGARPAGAWRGPWDRRENLPTP